MVRCVAMSSLNFVIFLLFIYCGLFCKKERCCYYQGMTYFKAEYVVLRGNGGRGKCRLVAIKNILICWKSFHSEQHVDAGELIGFESVIQGRKKRIANPVHVLITSFLILINLPNINSSFQSPIARFCQKEAPKVNRK